MLEELGVHLGLPPGTAAGTSLQSYLPGLGQLSFAINPGILVAGIYHRTRRRHGQQYCPLCVAENPIFLRLWRLAFLFCCPIHGCLLRDACPNCDSPVVVHRSLGFDMTQCHICQASLTLVSESPSVTMLNAQHHLLDAWFTGTVSLGKFTMNFPTWLAGLRLLFSALQRSELRNCVAPSIPQSEERCTPLEFSRINKRSAILPAAVYLSDVWPKRLLNLNPISPLHASTFIDHRRTKKPDWFVKTVLQNFPVQTQIRKPLIKTRIPLRLNTSMARRSLHLAPMITRRLDQLGIRH